MAEGAALFPLAVFFFLYFARSPLFPSGLTALGCYVSFFLAVALGLKRGWKRPSFSWSDAVFLLFLLFVVQGVFASFCFKKSLAYAFKELWIPLVYVLFRLFYSEEVRGALYCLLLPVFAVCALSFLLSTSPGDVRGLFSHKNTFGIFSEMSFLFLLYAAADVPALFIPCVASLLMVVLSGCRASIAISVLFGLPALFAHSPLLRRGLLFSLFLCLFVSLLVPSIRGRFVSLARLRDKSLEDRTVIVKTAFSLALDRFPWGWGFRRPWRCICKKNPRIIRSKLPAGRGELVPFMCRGGAHNLLVELFFEGGALGLAFGVLLYLYAAVFLVRAFKGGAGTYHLLPFLLLFSLLTHGLLEVILYSKRGVLLFSLLAICGNAEKSLSVRRES